MSRMQKHDVITICHSTHTPVPRFHHSARSLASALSSQRLAKRQQLKRFLFFTCISFGLVALVAFDAWFASAKRLVCDKALRNVPSEKVQQS